MFLDDELYEIGKNTGNSSNEILEAMAKMINKTFDYYMRQTESNSNIKLCFISFRRVNNSFVLAAKRLQKEGIGWCEEDLFKGYCESVPELKSISELLK